MRTHVSWQKFQMSSTGISFDSALMDCFECEEMAEKKKLIHCGMAARCSPFATNSFLIL